MSNLWSTALGRATVKEGVYDIIRRRIGRRWGRALVVEFNEWVSSGKTAFSYIEVLGEMNDANDPELQNLYELLVQLGDGDVTYADKVYYVNNLTGSDENGIGTEESPFATGAHVADFLRNTVIDHKIQVRYIHTAAVGQTVYVEDYLYLPHNIRNGTLAFFGVGAPIETKSEEDINNKTVLGAGGTMYRTTAGAPYIADQWIGEWMLVTSGAADQWAYPILSNDVNSIFTPQTGIEPAIADTFVGVVPAVKIQLNQLSVKTQNMGQAVELGAGDLTSSVVFANLDFDFTGTDMDVFPMQVYGQRQYVNFEFVNCTFKDNVTNMVNIETTNFNGGAAIDEDLLADCQAGILNIGLGGSLSAGMSVRRATQVNTSFPTVIGSNSEIKRLVCSDFLDLSYGNSLLTGVGANGMFCSSRKAGPIGILSAILANKGSIAIKLYGVEVYMQALYIMTGAKAIEITDSCILRIDDSCECAATIAGYTLEAGPNVFISTTGPLANFSATTGDILFTAPNPDVAVAWPAAGTLVGDAIGGAGIHSSHCVQAG